MDLLQWVDYIWNWAILQYALVIYRSGSGVSLDQIVRLISTIFPVLVDKSQLPPSIDLDLSSGPGSPVTVSGSSCRNFCFLPTKRNEVGEEILSMASYKIMERERSLAANVGLTSNFPPLLPSVPNDHIIFVQSLHRSWERNQIVRNTTNTNFTSPWNSHKGYLSIYLIKLNSSWWEIHQGRGLGSQTDIRYVGF